MIRSDILAAMTPDERAEFHDLVIDARQYRYEMRKWARYDEVARLEWELIRVRKAAGDFAKS